MISCGRAAALASTDLETFTGTQERVGCGVTSQYQGRGHWTWTLLDTPPHHCTPADLCVTCGAMQLLSLCCQAKLKLKITKIWALNWLQETKFMSPTNRQMKQDRQWLSEYQSPDQLSLSSAGLIFALQPAPGILQSRQHCRLCRLQCCSRVGAGRRAGIPPRPRSRAIWPLQIL